MFPFPKQMAENFKGHFLEIFHFAIYLELALIIYHFIGKTEKQLEDGSDQQDQDPVKMLCKSNEEYERKITELLGAGELLMNEWHEIKQYIKRFNDWLIEPILWWLNSQKPTENSGEIFL